MQGALKRLGSCVIPIFAACALSPAIMSSPDGSPPGETASRLACLACPAASGCPRSLIQADSGSMGCTPHPWPTAAAAPPAAAPAGERATPRAAKPPPDMHFVRVSWCSNLGCSQRATYHCRASWSQAPAHPLVTLVSLSALSLELQQHVQQALPAALHARGLLQQTSAVAADATYAGAVVCWCRCFEAKCPCC